MNLIPELESVLEELTRRFGAQLKWAPATQPNELHLHAKVELAGALCSAFHKIHNGRLVGVFAEDARTEHNAYFVYYLYVLDWAHGFVLVRVALPPDHPELPSVTNAVHGVDWQEREIQDMFGISLLGHPNPRRCVLHDDWPEVYPLRKDFNLRAQLPPFTGPRHKFREVEGEGVFQVPVGPVHAGIIEPGHFLFSVAGEPVLYLQLRLFYVHKGIEKLFESIPVAHCVRLAESISGDSSFAHATAFCHAVERAAGVQPPPRARALRTLCLELERLYNHVADIGALCNDVGFGLAQAWALTLREQLLQLNREITGHRLLRGGVVPGGARLRRLPSMAELTEIGHRFEELVDLASSNALVMERFSGTATLDASHARDLGVVGVAGRASGLAFDARTAHPFVNPIDGFSPVLHSGGDVLARYTVRVDEVRASLSCIANLVDRVASLDSVASLRGYSVPNPADGGVGIAEGWRGVVVHRVELDTQRRISRVKVVDPSFLNWPALPVSLADTIVPDFPLANKSFNLSYAGNDL